MLRRYPFWEITSHNDTRTNHDTSTFADSLRLHASKPFTFRALSWVLISDEETHSWWIVLLWWPVFYVMLGRKASLRNMCRLVRREHAAY